jgi:hypothetical protein
MYGDALLLRHVVKLLAIDLRLRIKVSSLRGAQQETRQKLMYNSILWNVYAVGHLTGQDALVHLLMAYPPLRAGLLCAVPCICLAIANMLSRDTVLLCPYTFHMMSSVSLIACRKHLLTRGWRSSGCWQRSSVM